MKYAFNTVTQEYVPALYPGEKADKWSIPDNIKSDFSKLNAIIETKYTREYLKICAFYNKLFPSLKYTTFTRSSYNVPPFTTQDQERQDTGTGVSLNYLKQIIDQIVSRIGTTTFDPALVADMPTLEYVVYKDEVERLLRRTIRNENLQEISMQCFHDAAVVGYSHIIIDPWTGKLVKMNDYEVGMFEPQFNKGVVKQLLYRDYAFPAVALTPYLENEDDETKQKVIDAVGARSEIDLKLYIDCTKHEAYCTVGGTTLTPIEYPFDDVQFVTFAWDTGFSKVTSTSLFDLLYPVQRELNKVVAKMQQLIRMYKGATPVFNSDVDLAMKSITNGSGECLYVDSTRPIDTLMTVINPTPLDPALSAEVQNYKTQMYELAGLQQVSFDMENMRSAAAVIALDQTRDNVFQNQLYGISNFIKRLFVMWVRYNAKITKDEKLEAVLRLVQDAVINLQPVHLNDPLTSKANTEPATDYLQMQTSNIVLKILKGNMTFDDLPYNCNLENVKMIAALTSLRLSALDIEEPDSLSQFMVAAFIDDVKSGVVDLAVGVPEEVMAQANVPEGEEM